MSENTNERENRIAFENAFSEYCREKYGSMVSEYDLQCIGFDRTVALIMWDKAIAHKKNESVVEALNRCVEICEQKQKHAESFYGVAEGVKELMKPCKPMKP